MVGLGCLLGGHVMHAQQAQPPVQAPAQEQPAPPSPQQGSTIQVGTKLVVLDVVVTDKSANPVTNLTKDDFTVTEETEPQVIRHFEPPSAHPLPPGELVHSSADLPKIGDATVDILVLDELNTPFEENAYSRYSLQRFLKRQPPTMPPTTLLVANDKSFAVLQDYTQDRNLLQAALKRDPVVYPWRRSMNGGAGEDGVVRLGQSIQTLQSIAQAAAGTPGRKTVIWVGKGFPSVDLTNLDGDSASKLYEAIKRCTNLLLQSRVTLYIVDPAGLSSTTYDNSADTPVDLAALEEESGDEPFSNGIRFSTLAPATGGRVFKLRNDIDQEIATSIQDGSLYYTISYRPTGESDEPGEYRHIRILMKDPKLIASTRDGYYAPGVSPDGPKPDPSAQAKVAEGEQVIDVANAALSKMVYTGVKLRAVQGSPGRFSIAVADSSLTWNSAAGDLAEAKISIIAVCFSAKGKVLSHATEEKTLQTKSPNATAAAEELFTLPVALAPGTVRLRLVVRDSVSGRLGTADLNIP
jgi:VWFA-related protein